MFWVRLRSSIILVILALVTMFAGGKILLATMIFLSVIAYWELCRASGVGGEIENEKDAGKERQDERNGRWKKNGLEIVGILGILFYYALLWVNEETELMTQQTGILFSTICVFMGGMFVYVFGLSLIHI